MYFGPEKILQNYWNTRNTSKVIVTLSEVKTEATWEKAEAHFLGQHLKYIMLSNIYKYFIMLILKWNKYKKDEEKFD